MLAVGISAHRSVLQFVLHVMHHREYIAESNAGLPERLQFRPAEHPGTLCCQVNPVSYLVTGHRENGSESVAPAGWTAKSYPLWFMA